MPPAGWRKSRAKEGGAAASEKAGVIGNAAAPVPEAVART
jgi:hypothetical protein